MDRLKDYLKNNFIHALKSILYNYKQYLSFFVAVFVVQMLFWSLTLSADTDRTNVARTVESTYDCHIVIRHMSQEHYAILNNKIYVKNFEKNRAYEDVKFSSSADLLGRVYYTAYVTLSSDLENASKAFEEEYIRPMRSAGTDFEVIHTPLETYEEDYLRENNKTYWLLMLLMTVLSVLLLMALYNIRINHYKFLYGVYMTCGADFRKLFQTAVWELLVVSCITFLPSMLCAILSAFLIYRSMDVGLVFSVSAIFKVLLFNFIAVFASVWLPMKWMARKTPMSLIVAQDNANLVSSPRRSFRIFKRKMPLYYETFSIWRFRTYFVKLLATATAFSALFLCGLYVTQMVQTRLDSPIEEFFLSADEHLDDDLIESVMETEGIDYCYWENTMLASLLVDHVLLTREQGAAASSYTMPSSEQAAYSLATNNYQYMAVDALLLDMIIKQGVLEIEGDPYAVLTQENTVILSDSLANTRCLNIQPGDKVMLAEFLYTDGNRLDNTLDVKDLLRQQIELFGFAYTEYTVCAVIHGDEAGNAFTFGVNPELYETLTGSEPTRKSVEVYVSPDADMDTIQAAYDAIYEQMDLYQNGRVTETNEFLSHTLEKAKNMKARLILISLLVLLICPLVWFFSQILFFAKRKPEMDALRSFGAVEREIRGVYLLSGVYMAVASIFMTLLLAYSASGILFLLCNRVAAALGMGDGTRYAFYMSTPALISCIGLSMLFGFLSAMVPYLLYRSRRKRELRTGIIEMPKAE